jgi:hypothetical protein
VRVRTKARVNKGKEDIFDRIYEDSKREDTAKRRELDGSTMPLFIPEKDIVLEKLRYHAEGNTPPVPTMLPCVEADTRKGLPGGAVRSSMLIFLRTTSNVLSTFLRTP